MECIAVLGLGYVGLNLSLAFAKKFPNTIGFDIDLEKVEALKQGTDPNGERSFADLSSSSLQITNDPTEMEPATFFVVTAPTPIDQNHRPDLAPLISASQIVGKFLKPGSVVVYESTVYPGVTEDICGPILAQISGLRQGIDFKLGYSPERINPGDREHTLEKIVKVVAAEDAETLDRVASAYERIIQAGVYRAPSIKTAEAAKVIENIQRDLNIALMNELALIFEKLDIRTADVIAAASTKWNFLPFKPGLVGGHCIGVDPYYLTAKAQELGYHPEVILAGRRINDNMGIYLAQRLIKLLSVHADKPLKQARVGILGLTFKENVRDLRNSRVPDIVRELNQFGIEPFIHDPIAHPKSVQHEYGIELSNLEQFTNLDAVIFAVTHRNYLENLQDQVIGCLRSGGILMDVKSVIKPHDLPSDLIYWSL
ncbi:nucleotide sugar dehydrogenase [Kovacikia minuta CCNUW1]|uniref:nucleotide sugar dehydrogenase n=1 Tax=Kovacikia minuta TaxID=2931930 RepID=UPI001CCDB554|nr:nucleotide sugar dehydrogenase [Kovacikia minuta]UBF23692.1 nucleotide sugar dehydrogenase [Kovacikia minuta CCNUW1]